jgi:hypothetical protein
VSRILPQRASFRVELLLPIACAAAAVVLGVSEFATTFELRPPGGETQELLKASDRHHYSILVLAIFALIAILITVLTGARPAAFAVAAAGGIALLIFLIGDLPDVNKVGTLNDPRQSFLDSKAYPAAGFWLELIGALLLTLCGGALATLRPDQLKQLNPSQADQEPSYQR